jgi:hypothetical protein
MGHIIKVDSETGLMYYFNCFTGDSRWEPPGLEEEEEEEEEKEKEEAQVFDAAAERSETARRQVVVGGGEVIDGSEGVGEEEEEGEELAEDWEQHMYQEARKQQQRRENARFYEREAGGDLREDMADGEIQAYIQVSEVHAGSAGSKQFKFGPTWSFRGSVRGKEKGGYALGGGECASVDAEPGREGEGRAVEVGKGGVGGGVRGDGARKQCRLTDSEAKFLKRQCNTVIL